MALRPAEADADAHAARRAATARSAWTSPRRSVCRIRCCRNRWCARNVWRDWLPDIYLNPHGYPSHEWVQQFAGYVPPGLPDVSVDARLVHAAIGGAARSALSRSRAGDRGDARGDRHARSTPTGRARDESAASGAVSQVGVRVRPVRLQSGDLQGHGDLLQRSGERRAERQPASRRRTRRRPAAEAKAAPAAARAASR